MTTKEEEHLYCQICGEELAESLVWCSQCKTPHHADCWQFNNGCSTYGCGSKKALKESPHGTKTNDALLVIDSDKDDLVQFEDKDSVIYITEDAVTVLKPKKTFPSLVGNIFYFSCYLLSAIFKPSTSFWTGLYKLGTINKRGSLARDVIGDEGVDAFNSVVSVIVGFIATICLIFAHLGPIAGQLALMYLVFGPLAHYFFWAFTELDEDGASSNQITARPSSYSAEALPPTEQRRKKRKKKKKRRRRRRRRRR